MRRAAAGPAALLAGAALLAAALGAALAARSAPAPGRAAEHVDVAPQPPGGKWHAARLAEEGPGAAALLALPYAQGYRAARGAGGVVRHDRRLAWPGLNLYVSGDAAEARLLDMDGGLRHRWALALERFAPRLFRGPRVDLARRLDYWRRVALTPDGGLVAIYEGVGAVSLDRRSRVRWAYHGGAHHDLVPLPDGTIWLLDRRPARIPELAGDRVVLEDLVTLLGPHGRVRRQVSILRALAASPWRQLVAQLPAEPDVTHTNDLELLGAGAAAAGVPALRPGLLLLSLCRQSALVALDPVRGEVVWALTGGWRAQHASTLLPSGRILLFDNAGLGDRSRVVEVDPRDGRITWSWPPPAAAAGTLLSRTLGFVQRLPNGNTLITESENGRALEVTRDGRVAWELRSPHRVRDAQGRELVATLFAVERLPADDVGER